MNSMKYISYIIGIVLIIFIQSCDKIEPPYRDGNAGVTGANDTVIIGNDTIFFDTDTRPNVKRVLAEDYTGHLCGNCPYAGVLLNDTIKNTYGDKLVVISVHAGFFAAPCPGGAACTGSAPAGSFATDFRDTISTDWDNFFGASSSGNPCGMVDRIDYPGNHEIKSPDQWNGIIQTEAALAPDFKMRIINHYNPSTNQLNTAIRSELLNNKTDTFKLQVVITEDSIIDWQEWYPPFTPQFDPNYIHHHVLRKGVNGTFGTVLASGTITAGKVFLNGYTYTLHSSWNISHCKVVAFIYEASNYRVVQVEEQSVE